MHMHMRMHMNMNMHMHMHMHMLMHMLSTQMWAIHRGATVTGVKPYSCQRVMAARPPAAARAMLWRYVCSVVWCDCVDSLRLFTALI